MKSFAGACALLVVTLALGLYLVADARDGVLGSRAPAYERLFLEGEQPRHSVRYPFSDEPLAERARAAPSIAPPIPPDLPWLFDRRGIPVDPVFWPTPAGFAEEFAGCACTYAEVERLWQDLCGLDLLSDVVMSAPASLPSEQREAWYRERLGVLPDAPLRVIVGEDENGNPVFEPLLLDDEPVPLGQRLIAFGPLVERYLGAAFRADAEAYWEALASGPPWPDDGRAQALERAIAEQQGGVYSAIAGRCGLSDPKELPEAGAKVHR